MSKDVKRILWKAQWKILRRVNVFKERMLGYDFSENHSLNELGFTEEEANIYSATPNFDLIHTLKKVGVRPSDSILDFGAGKASAMHTMTKFNFARVDGVELSKTMHEIGQKNIERLGLKNASIFLSNATDFKDIDAYSFFYLFNPFPGNILEIVLENIKASYRNVPRKITLLYYLPAFREHIDNDSFFTLEESCQGRYFEMLIYTKKVV